MSHTYSKIVFQTFANLVSESSLPIAENLAGCAVNNDFNLSTAA
jgi:hypothetical protein